MKKLATILALTLVLAAPALARARDWSGVVTATPSGGYLIGNPAAPVKVIEFFSLTCSHCRDFAKSLLPKLERNYVAKGRASLELRNFVLNPADLAASILMRCGSPAQAVRYFHAIYADQEGAFAGAMNLSPQAAERITATPLPLRAAAMAREAGIAQWFVGQGLSPKRIDACLLDQRIEARLVDLRNEASSKFNVQGTPVFVVNGARISGSGWDQLEATIAAAESAAK